MPRVNIGNGDPSEACWGTLVVYFFCYGCLAPLLAFLYFLVNFEMPRVTLGNGDPSEACGGT